MIKAHINSIIIVFLFIGIHFIFENISIKSNEESPISKNLLLGKVTPANNPNFELIDKKYTHKSSLYMHNEAYKAFRHMHKAALSENINLNIVSAFRSFSHQKSIWEAKWNGRRKVLGNDLSKKYPNPKNRALQILKYSSMPGTSRHHWGTDIDIYSLEDESFQSGKGKEVYEWLKLNASIFGFCQTYTPKSDQRPNGYEEEKWHWSYTPIASKYMKAFEQTINYEDISGFEGSNTAKEINVISNYVLSINKNCR